MEQQAEDRILRLRLRVKPPSMASTIQIKENNSLVFEFPNFGTLEQQLLEYYSLFDSMA